MPELPEVETTLRGIAPHLLGRSVRRVIVRQRQLRWPVPAHLPETLAGARISTLRRRAKYLLLETEKGTLILHLGMSGSLRILPPGTPPARHDHFDLVFDHCCLRLRDPRRFGAVLWCADDPLGHPLLAHLGPEPLSEAFSGAYLYEQARTRRVAVKGLLMDGRIVVGVGNIYANEALFLSGIDPRRAACRISKSRYNRLAQQTKEVLEAAVRQGGTTLRDFQREDGKPGYFAQQLRVYGREGQPCPQCGAPVRQARIGQRSSFYCGNCQR
ncbi:MAG: DNA-formamidopyrimidine glycosylase [Candidatus Sedimenticola endophacoides]|uniref:Formamidopyrimidine-DNA glycosylase n=1 Tax=Candidatus Sedimenticola endophacoides TaxID=2548426 RepID=A0A657Q105_9GAMM|nr:MAG: DNA-formamidopyrimidine glycosylase [Candidatus Sedimenticola endophacoides]OQX35662.1 MAG: DNA-formamidopyrimidine glycosylase [Candidatus Sedimenticola endophacoides]OQX38969.1 MAG: DNA-formamidopyrimidine glycosylase [Candidatus Sedimenticola endophacoides]OQX40435.1 MAG: DNA-formamidopyrimidine glycosylase [Candidatus Sedimenticola endophacoides]OQX46689.1 MAG: DNA-formamidopyrimidine glycosylase [Candidatus Sedimenticola endophacoides]